MKILFLFGGQSAEHEVSLNSARTIVGAVDRDRYEVLLVAIDKKGCWRLATEDELAKWTAVPDVNSNEVVALAPGTKGKLLAGATSYLIDLVWPVLHGPHGEDGTVQGLCELAGVPYVGAGVLGSAVGMDKGVMKRLLREAGLPIGDFLVGMTGAIPSYEEVTAKLGSPVFVKPVNAGSSVGVSKVKTETEYEAAMKEALQFDRQIIIEQAITGRELECSVLGATTLEASIPGEVEVVGHDFYSYDAKYLDENGAKLHIPAQIPAETASQVQELAKQAFQALDSRGMGRVDFFLQEDGALLINEINTLPGFTSISMYPKLWEVSGVPLPELVERLIRLGLDTV